MFIMFDFPTKKSHLEVGRSLLLDLVGQRVDLEAIEAGDKLVGRSLWPGKDGILPTKDAIYKNMYDYQIP